MAEKNKKFKFMFHSMEGTGHLNACLGFAQTLAENGHEIVFAINESLQKAVEKFGFRVLPLKQNTESNDGKDKFILSENPAKDFAANIQQAGLFSKKSSYEKLLIFKEDKNNFFIEGLKKLIVAFNPQIEKFLKEEKPDAWIHDHFFVPPAILASKIPWMLIASAAPLMYYQSELLPPPASGYSFDDKSKWHLFIETREEHLKEFQRYQTEINEQCDYVEENADNANEFWRSPYLNIYQYPLELDYLDVDGFELPANFVGLDAFVRKDPGHFELPAEFLARETGSDKKIYLSMGSMGSFDIDLMQKIVKILSKLPYKVIVSKGPRGNEYELPENCWGENYLPQPEIVNLVDLVITHGGNNTFTETFAAGKRMIVMPMFGDQYDNAQRVHEKGYGIRIDPYDFTEQQLIDAVQKLMNNEELDQKLEVAKKRIAQSSRKQEACQKVEQLVSKYSSST